MQRIVQTYIKKMKLIRRAANAGGEEEGITLQPADILPGEFVACTGSAHVCNLEVIVLGLASCVVLMYAVG